jgi:Flp pilus assembly protein TadG
MLLIPSNRYPRRRGAVVVIVALMLAYFVLIGMAAIALDGGVLMDDRRRAQAAADAAAYAAAVKLYTNYPAIAASIDSSTGIASNPDPGGAADTAATNSAATNGFPNPTINIPPKTGPWANQPGFAEVIIQYQQNRYFSAVWDTSNLSVQARAVGQGYWGGSGDGIYVLDPSQKSSFGASSNNVGFSLTGNAAVIVDSASYEAASLTGGSGNSATAGSWRITGQNPGYVGSLGGTIYTGVPPTPDPLRNLPDPSTFQSSFPNGTMTKTSLGQGNFKYFLTPGLFGQGGAPNLPSTLTTGDQVVFQQASGQTGVSASVKGIYYFVGGFKSTGANLSMDPNTTGGIMIYNGPTNSSQSQGLQITGNSAGSVVLSPLTSGPYQGILLFQNRTSTVTMSVSGAGSFNMTGTFYAANAQLQVSGQSNSYIGSQYISRTLSLSGQGVVNVAYNDKTAAPITIVRLVQ